MKEKFSCVLYARDRPETERVKLKREECIHANCGGFVLRQHRTELKLFFPELPFQDGSRLG